MQVTRGRLALVVLVLLCASGPSDAQTSSVLQGRVFDSSGGPIQGAAICRATTRLVSPWRSAPIPKGATTSRRSPPGRTLALEAPGLRSETIEALNVDAWR